jgi:predicted lipid-binding transport protein (Tim44 family)
LIFPVLHPDSIPVGGKTHYGGIVTKFSILTAIILGLGLILLTMPDLADAKRLGGGGSFGSKPSYSKNFSKPAPTPSSPAQQAAPGASPMGGRGMFGGMLGGMLMGGLLGSMLFGGAFSGISFIDILLIGGGLFLLFRFLRSRQPAMQPAGGPAGGQPAGQPGAAWDNLRSARQQTQAATENVPPGFDANEFLDGAKAAYVRLQGAWDARDLDDLRQFTSDEVFAVIKGQTAEDPAPGRTEILLLEARLLEVKALGNQTIATVLFDAMLREGDSSSPAEQVREAWHFSRYEAGGSSHWVVEGIQQLEK